MNSEYLKRAEQNFPQIFTTEVEAGADCGILTKNDEFVIDLGNHYVGYFSFNLDWVDIYPDAPVRLYVKFCETGRELEDDFAAYQEGLCASWLQEEYINIDFPGEYKMPRRYAARYIKIKVVATPRNIVLNNFKFAAVSSGDISQLKQADIADEQLRRIDAIAVNTLKNCMHRVFEDGPKRDRRLWIGDLRLEALANYCTFDNRELVRRCMYLFAAADTNSAGFIPGFVYENPAYVAGNWHLMDYALLYAATVCDYYIHTGDGTTFDELYPAVKSQLQAAHGALGNDGIITVPAGCDVFIDWCRGLGKITALHGVYMYTLRILSGVLEDMGHPDAQMYAQRYKAAKQSALDVLYNEVDMRFANDKDGCQYSVHSAVWMILGGAVEGDTARRILTDVLNSDSSIKPFTPYMHHYVAEAMLTLGLKDMAEQYIRQYWGAMADMGADTFYEVFVPGDMDFSPYKDRMVNSMCHAWSCTPSYFIRKYFI